MPIRRWTTCDSLERVAGSGSGGGPMPHAASQSTDQFGSVHRAFAAIGDADCCVSQRMPHPMRVVETTKLSKYRDWALGAPPFQ